MATAFTKNGEQFEPTGTPVPVAERVFQLQSEVARDRRQPLSQELVDLLDSVAAETGVVFEVVSGGQRARRAGEPRTVVGERTGSNRHDNGLAGDVKAYVIENGQKRYLDFTDPEDNATWARIVQLAVASGATGLGAGTDYMGNNTVHIGFGTPLTWGAGGRSANAPQWLKDAYALGTKTPPLNIPGGEPVPAQMPSRIAGIRSGLIPPQPVPATASNLEDLRRRYAIGTSGAIPRPRTPSAELMASRNPPLPRPRPALPTTATALPVDPRLSRPAGSLPAARPPIPVPFLGSDGSVRGPTGYPPELAYGPDNRMNQGGVGSLLNDTRISPGMLNPAPRPPVNSVRPSGPVGGLPAARPPLQAVRPEGPAGGFPAAAPRPATSPVGSGAPVSLTPFSTMPSVPKTQFGGAGMPSSSSGGGAPVVVPANLLELMEHNNPPLPVPRPSPTSAPKPISPIGITGTPGNPIDKYITVTKQIPNPAYIKPVPLEQTIRVENGVPVGLAPINPALKPRSNVPEMLTVTERILNPAYKAPIPAMRPTMVAPRPVTQSAGLLQQRQAAPASVVSQLRAQGYSAPQAYSIASSAATRPTNIAERNQARQSASDAAGRALYSSISG